MTTHCAPSGSSHPRSRIPSWKAHRLPPIRKRQNSPARLEQSQKQPARAARSAITQPMANRLRKTSTSKRCSGATSASRLRLQPLPLETKRKPKLRWSRLDEHIGSLETQHAAPLLMSENTEGPAKPICNETPSNIELKNATFMARAAVALGSLFVRPDLDRQKAQL